MQLVRQGRPVRIQLRKDLLRSIKQGHAWVYSDAIELPAAPAGSCGLLHDRRGGKRIASGIYDPRHPIPLRICQTEHPFALDDQWCSARLEQAIQLRETYFGSQPSGRRTTGFRLVAGEGDGLPGLIIDRYADTAVIKLDGGAPEAFYQPAGIACRLCQRCSIQRVVLRHRGKGRAGETLLGESRSAEAAFLENGLEFKADVLHGQKTGFFLDQRDNRTVIRALSRDRRVLNLFSYNGGFSVAAGAGGASHVTSVDLAPAAVESAHANWAANGLDPQRHMGIADDCFAFLERAIEGRHQWDLVICDPPSFAPSEKSRPQALAAYGRLARLAARVTVIGGLVALASCSSHIEHAEFVKTNLNALGRERRKARLIIERGLPIDHPTPFAMNELRYLKFLLLSLDGQK